MPEGWSKAANLLSDVINLLGGEEYPCRQPRARQSCIRQQERKDNGSMRAWPEYEPKKMCVSCAAYWHASHARNLVLDEDRTQALIRAEKTKGAKP